MDVLSDVLRVIRISGAVLFHAEFSAPWCVASPPAREIGRWLTPGAGKLILFHIVAEGECWAERQGSAPVHLAAGDVLVLPHGDAHAMSDMPGRDATPVAAILPPLPWPTLPVVAHGGTGPITRVLCGFLQAEEPVLHPLLAELPAVLHVRARNSKPLPRLETMIAYTLDEARSDRPGAGCLLTRLTDVLFVEILRRHMEDLPEPHPGPWRALKDPVTRRALELLHAQTDEPWSLDALARRSGASRSVLAARFRELVGCPPMQYLMRWRLHLAAHHLRTRHDSTAAVAALAGYESQAAFNRAFKRYVGEPPATWRKRHKIEADAVAQ